MESPDKSKIIQTATVGIFSPDMKRMIVIVNRRLSRILPPWGKFDPIKDWDIIDTLLREIAEEIRLALFPGTGVFLNPEGKATDNIQPVLLESFDFIDGNGSGRDSLFLFRLHDDILWRILCGETQGFFLTKKELMSPRMEMGGNMHELFLPLEQKSQMKDLILSVMVGTSL